MVKILRQKRCYRLKTKTSFPSCLNKRFYYLLSTIDSWQNRFSPSLSMSISSAILNFYSATYTCFLNTRNKVSIINKAARPSVNFSSGTTRYYRSVQSSVISAKKEPDFSAIQRNNFVPETQLRIERHFSFLFIKSLLLRNPKPKEKHRLLLAPGSRFSDSGPILR